ncbi:MAG: DUF6171 family protein [Huintestinicola sp.]
MTERTVHPCRRCLLSEFDKDLFLSSVAECIERIPEEKRTSEEEYSRRLSLCRECDMLNEGMCGECGCFAELRAAKNFMHCPVEKW